MQKKLLKQKEQELFDKNRPNSSRPVFRGKGDPILSVQKVDMLETEFDEDGNEIINPAR